MKERLLAATILILLGLGISVLIMICIEDKDPPVIHFPKQKIVYTQNDDYKVLLESVTAFDEQDGDVSDSLTVEDIYPNTAADTATVIYAARDSHNNVAKQRLVITYIRQEEEDLPLTKAVDSSQEAATEETEKETQKETEKETKNNSRESAAETVSKGSPRIILTRKSVVMDEGDDLNRLSFIKSVSDDKDTEEYLSGRIQITGDEFDRNKPGTYKQIFFVIDSDGNKSNEAELIITVR